MPKILQKHLIIGDDIYDTLEKLLQLPPVQRYYKDRLKTDLEREHFRQHLGRYTYMWSPDAPFEVSTTNRYLVDTHEAAVTARAEIARGEIIRHLTGVQVPLTKDEEKTLDLTRRDFSVVVSARKRTVSLFLGPARFANHDCDANARLRTCGNRGMEVIAVKDIKVGEEITVTYSEDYFGVDNKECLCATCESFGRNGWADDSTPEPDDGRKDIPRDQQTRSPQPRSGSGSRSRNNSRSSSRQRLTPSTPSKKRKSEAADLETTERSPKRPDFVKISDASGKRASSSLSNEIRPQDIPDRVQAPSNLEHVSSPLGLSTSTSSKSSHADGASSSTAPTSLSENDNSNHANRYRIERTRTPKDSLRSGDHQNLQVPNGVSSPRGQSHRKRHGIESPTSPGQTEFNGSKSAAHAEQLTSRLESASNDIGMPVIAEPAEDVAEFDASERTRRLPNTKGRRPGDYTLTARLLCTPYSRWVQCKVCEGDFVQIDAYQTRYACPRCERHSKLYGYQWPKTEKEGKFDEEERILDHREVNRFVGPQQEKEIKKGKEKALKNLLKEREENPTSSAQEDEDEWEDVTPARGRVFRKSLGKRTFFGRDQDVEDIFSRKNRTYPPDPFALTASEPSRAKKPKEVQHRPIKAATQFRPFRQKRKYVRSGNYTREAMAERAAAREAMREQLKRQKKQRRKELKMAKAAAAAKEKQESPPTKSTPPKPKMVEKKKSKPTLPEGAKPSKWKGWILVPDTEGNQSSNKTYDSTGKRIKEGAIQPILTQQRSSRPMPSNRPARPKMRASAPAIIKKRKYIRSGKYVGVAEERKRKRGLLPDSTTNSTAQSLPASASKSTPTTKRATPKSKPPTKPKYTSETKYKAIKKSRPIPTYEEIQFESGSEAPFTTPESESVYDSISGSERGHSPTSTSAYESGDVESGSDFEVSSTDHFPSRRQPEPKRKSGRAKKQPSPTVQSEPRTRQTSKSAKDSEPPEPKSSPAGKLNRVPTLPYSNVKMPKGWVLIADGNPRKEDESDDDDMDWEAEANAAARARVLGEQRRNRKTL